MNTPDRDVLLPGIRIVVPTERHRSTGLPRKRELDDIMAEAERRGIDPRRWFWMTYDRALAFAEFQQEGAE